MTEQGPGLTVYTVLRDSGSGTWKIERAGVSARDASAAVRHVYESLDWSRGETGPQPATFVAIPVRSFNPIKVTPKIETTLVLEDAS